MNLKPYLEYKDSGVEWIGDIPENWKASKVKFVSSRILTGKTPPSESPEYYDKNDLDWFTPGDLGEKLELTEASKKISKLAIFDNKAIKFKPLSVLIVGIGATLGKIGITKNESSSNQQINAIEFDPNKIIPKYGLYYLLGVKDYIISLSNASTIGIFNKTQTENFQLLNPPLNEQSIIYSFLDKKTSEIDLTIEKDTRLIELLKEKRTALINHVVTKGLDPTVKMKDSGVEWIGEIPVDWEVRKLGFYLNLITYGFTNPMPLSDKGPYLITAEGVNHGKILYSKCRKTTREAFRLLLTNKSRPKINDILLTKDGTLGRTALVTEEDCCINQSVALLRPNSKIIPKYLKFLLESPNYQHRMKFDAKGTTIKHIQITILNKMEISVPPIQEQKQIIEYFEIKTNKIDQLIQKIQNNIELLEEYKKSLIHHVVTGKVDVREVAV